MRPTWGSNHDPERVSCFIELASRARCFISVCSNNLRFYKITLHYRLLLIDTKTERIELIILTKRKSSVVIYFRDYFAHDDPLCFIELIDWIRLLSWALTSFENNNNKKILCLWACKIFYWPEK